MTRILVTGASGLLGLNLALEAAKEHDVTGMLHRRALQGVPFATMQADLLAAGEVERILDETQPAWIVHCAALANLDECERRPDLAQQLNAELPGRLATAAADRGLRLLHISTDGVFDGQRGNYAESDQTNPLSVYARTKLAGEQAVTETNSDALIARVNFFGWSASGQRSLAEFFFNNLSQRQAVQGHADRFFSPLLVNDLAAILLEMLTKGLSGLYHVASSERLSKYEFGQRLARRFGLDESLIEPISWRDQGLDAPRSPDLSLDTAKLATALGRELPTANEGIDGLHELYLQGYPQKLQAMLATSPVSESA